MSFVAFVNLMGIFISGKEKHKKKNEVKAGVIQAMEMRRFNEKTYANQKM